MQHGRTTRRTQSLTNVSDMNPNDLCQLIGVEVKSASHNVLKDLIHNKDFRAIMKQEIIEAVNLALVLISWKVPSSR